MVEETEKPYRETRDGRKIYSLKLPKPSPESQRWWEEEFRRLQEWRYRTSLPF
jgi:hypothetical protein